MSLVEEDLPGVNKVRGDFQVREDESLAHKLQEQEFEEHYNSNVQLRRTARVDAGVAVDLQKAEVERYRSEESARRLEIEAKEKQDREHAELMAKQIQEEEEAHRAIKLKDEAIAKTLFEKEQQKMAVKKRQEEADARLARQSSLAETQAEKERRQKELLSEQAARRLEQEERYRLEKKYREEQLSEAEAKRLHHLQKQAIERKKRELIDVETQRLRQPGTARPQSHSVSGSGPTSLPAGGLRPAPVAPGQPSASLPPRASSSGRTRINNEAVDSGSAPGDGFQLPSYDDLVGGGEETPVIDENERIALQEAEDEKLARQLAQTRVTDTERERREREDREYVQRLLKEEKKQVHKQSSPHHQADADLAKRLQQEEVEARKRQKQRSASLDQQQTPLSGEDAASLELARRLQKEEVMRVRQLKQQKLAQQRLIESEVERRKQGSPQAKRPAPSRPPGDTGPRQQPTNPQPTQSSRAPQHTPPATHSPDHLPDAQFGQPGTAQQPVVSSYRPTMAGYQVPLSSQMSEGIPQARPSYKRDPKKKGKK